MPGAFRKLVAIAIGEDLSRAWHQSTRDHGTFPILEYKDYNNEEFTAAAQESEVALMTGLDALHSVQFVTKKGKRLAVLSVDDWESLIEWLETLEDVAIAKDAFAKLKAAKGDRKRAGWLEWNKVKDQLA
jgi:hypothetical protein